VDDVDYSAAETLRSVHAKLKERGIRLVVAEIMDDVKTRTHYRFLELLGEDAHYDKLEDVLKQYRQQFNVAAPSNRSDKTPGVDLGA
jgi:MFS superfamily sulfate permease-like transporter